MSNGLVMYQGPSRIDGAPIVVIATGCKRPSENVKTGGMVQTWILRADVAPNAAIKTQADFSICGNCPHRGDPETGAGRSCYVRPWEAPLAVWKAWKRGSYDVATDLLDVAQRLAGKPVRVGAYGEPTAVPRSVWDTALLYATTWTGYTHRWQENPEWRDFLMASVDSPEETKMAQASGWRTFRVKVAGQPLLAGEIECPAARKLTQCVKCGLCNGRKDGDKRKNLVIDAHGRGFKHVARRLQLVETLLPVTVNDVIEELFDNAHELGEFIC